LHIADTCTRRGVRSGRLTSCPDQDLLQRADAPNQRSDDPADPRRSTRCVGRSAVLTAVSKYRFKAIS
jgi:hypothetical protein